MYPSFDGIEVGLQILHVFLYPLVLHAFLHTCFRVSNPFLTSNLDFPGYAYHVALRDQSDAFFEGAERVPKTVFEGLDDAEEGAGAEVVGASASAPNVEEMDEGDGDIHS